MAFSILRAVSNPPHVSFVIPSMHKMHKGIFLFYFTTLASVIPRCAPFGIILFCWLCFLPHVDMQWFFQAAMHILYFLNFFHFYFFTIFLFIMHLMCYYFLSDFFGCAPSGWAFLWVYPGCNLSTRRPVRHLFMGGLPSGDPLDRVSGQYSPAKPPVLFVGASHLVFSLYSKPAFFPLFL